jgi:predicted nucleic acid-binding protein
MNVDRMFLDANVLVYAHDRSEPDKRAIAVKILQACWENRSRHLSASRFFKKPMLH